MLALLLLALALPSAPPVPLDGEDWPSRDYQNFRLADGAYLDWAGSALATDGETLVVGVWRREMGGLTQVGLVQMYDRDGDRWIQGQRIDNPDPEAYDRFGYAVTVEGDTMVVSARGESSVADAQGALYVYEKQAGSWQLMQELRPGGTSTEVFLGESLDLEGDVLAAGSDRDFGLGSVLMFDRVGGSWQLRETLYESAGGGIHPAFGASVSLSEGRLAVGAPWWQFLSGPAGLVFIYTDDGTAWQHTATLSESDPYPDDNFGQSVALQGGRCVVGCPWDVVGGTYPGSAVVFEFDGSQWTETTKLVPSGAAHDQFAGFSVSQWNDLVLVGGPGRYNSNFPGMATLFQHTSLGWCERASFESATPQDRDRFGLATALVGESLVVGNPWSDLGSEDEGRIETRRVSPPTDDFCFGDGTGAPCPCGAGATGHGCPNADHVGGARLETSGLARLSHDSLRLHARDMGSTTVLFFQGTAPIAGGAGIVFGDGLRCVGGTVTRLGASITSGEATIPGQGDESLSVKGGAFPGLTIYYQGWYRDSSGACMAEPFNLTNAVEVTWEP